MRNTIVLVSIFVMFMAGLSLAVSTDLQVPGTFNVKGVSTFESNITSTNHMTLESTSNGNIIFSPNGTGITTTPKQINSTLPLGTAPLTVTSSTTCTNLNADYFDGWNSGGMLVLISAEETDASATGTTTPVKSYSVGANTYSRIMVESEIGLDAAGGEDATKTFKILYDATEKEVTTLESYASGAGDSHRLAGTIKYSEPFQGGGTVQIYVYATTAAGTWRVKSFRVYGRI